MGELPGRARCLREAHGEVGAVDPSILQASLDRPELRQGGQGENQ